MFNAVPDDVFFSNGQLVKNPNDLISGVTKGMRFIRPDGVPDAIWMLIEKCWEQNPTDRWTFSDIVKVMRESDDMVVPGTDLDEYHAYQDRIMTETRNVVEGHLSLSTLHVEKNEATLSVRGLSKADPHLRSVLIQSVKRMFTSDENDQAYRPYDFLKDTE
jgi:hypothetical protein